MNPYAFLDRDGTVIVEKNYLADPDGVELLPGAVAAMRLLVKLGYRLALVTNQAGVGRGLFGEETVHAVNQRLVDLLAAEGLAFDGIYYCPHSPDDGCDCRKPKPGMIRQAQRELAIDMAQSVMIGDRSSDIGLGKAVGLRTILVETGYGLEHGEIAGADVVVADLLAAAEWLASQRGDDSP